MIESNNESKRYRRWFIEINQNADCYNTFKDYLNGVKGFYAYNYHDKDINDDGEPKTAHYHLCLDYANPRTFEQVKKTFVGAHIDRPLFWESSIQYLCHKNDPNKYQYDRMEVVTNDRKIFDRAFDNVIISHFDFNDLDIYFKDYVKWFGNIGINVDRFIIDLLHKFPLDKLKIISKHKQIEDYIRLLMIDSTFVFEPCEELPF